VGIGSGKKGKIGHFKDNNSSFKNFEVSGGFG